MKLERSNVDYPLWRKKVDSSLFNHKGTTIPAWACQMWNIAEQFKNINSKNDQRSKVIILFEKEEYDGWVTEAKEKRQHTDYGIKKSYYTK